MLRLAADITFEQIEAACGPAPVLALYDGPTLPAAFDAPETAPPGW